VTSTEPSEVSTAIGTCFKAWFRNQPACTKTVCGTSMKFSARFVTSLSKSVIMK